MMLTIEMLDDSSEGVSVGSDDDLLAFLQLWDDDVVPVRQGSFDGELQGLEFGELVLWRSILVNGVFNDVFEVLVVGFHRWWWSVKGPSPDLHLFFAVFLGSFGLVHAGQATIVTFVQSPCLLDGDRALAGFRQDRLKGDVGALENRCVGHVELEPSFLDGLSGVECFLLALFAEVGVVPAAEEIQLVPFALTVANHHNLVFSGHSDEICSNLLMRRKLSRNIN